MSAAAELAGGETDLETCMLVGVAKGTNDELAVETSLDELERLASTAGAKCVGRIVQRRVTPDPATYIGKGKVSELRAAAAELGADTVIFDDELKPGQQQNLSEALDRKVIDRTGLILDIFALHADTAEGKIQVELAQDKYRLSRLTGRGNLLSRLGGGIGTRGPGEQKLEVDRRRIRQRIATLERELKKVERRRQTKRRRRKRAEVPLVALVGYTNAGKSTLMNKLTDSGVLVGDQLFSTLDPASSRLRLSEGREVVLSDTVGFVRKLPHQLIEAFRSTLEEVVDADLLVHVVDVSSPEARDHVRAVRRVLAEIGAADIPELLVLNKIDLMGDGEGWSATGAGRDALEGGIAVSAVTGKGLDTLVDAIGKALGEGDAEVEVILPYEEGALISRFHRTAMIMSEEHRSDGVRIRALVPPKLAAAAARYLT